jgi:DNA-binding response OmpR family regulator
MLRWEDRVESASCFKEAQRILQNEPPDALIVNLTPTDLPWRALKDICDSHQPPIPVIYESCVFKNAADAGIGDLSANSTFLPKPYPLKELKQQLRKMLRNGSPQRRGESQAAQPPANSGP